jgi:Ca2+-binding RTX toxin-like protein
LTFDVVGTDDPVVMIAGTGGGGGTDNTEVTVDGLLVNYQVFIETAAGFDRMEVFNAADSKPSFDLSGITIGSNVGGSPIDMSFDVEVTDKDGDTSDGTIEVKMVPAGQTLTGTDGDDALIGDSSNDVLIGGEGDDVMYGNAGGDVFVWDSEADVGLDLANSDFVVDFIDVVKDFSGAGDGDTLDISALLTDMAGDISPVGNVWQVVEGVDDAQAELQIDIDGAVGGTYTWQTIAYIESEGVTDDALIVADITGQVITT